MCLKIEGPITQCCEWQKINTSVRSWIVELKEELHNIERNDKGSERQMQ
jgi:hypothetical protein